MSQGKARWFLGFLAVGVLLVGAGVAQAYDVWSVPGNTAWANWNTADANWLLNGAGGNIAYTDGDIARFMGPVATTRNIFIGTGASTVDGTGGTPVAVNPGAVNFWANNAGPYSPGTSAVWHVTGGDITGASTAMSVGWDVSVYFDGYSSSLSFGGGTDVATGWIYYKPTVAGDYHFGTGAINLYRNYNYFIFAPTVAGCTLSNNFTVQSGGGQLPAPTNGGQFTGTFTLNGPLAVNGFSFSAPIVLNTSTSISTSQGNTNSTSVGSAIDGGGAYGLTLNIGGNTTAWTDYRMYISGPTTAWNVSGVSLVGPGNVCFVNPRNTGSSLNLAMGAALMGNAATPQDWIPDAAAVNFTGGKLYLRGDGANNETETVASVNLNKLYSEIWIRPGGVGVTNALAATGGLTRSNYATALINAVNLDGTPTGSIGATAIMLPSAPTLVGGMGTSGTNQPIVPYMIGGTSITDNDRDLVGDYGSTFVTYDAGLGSLKTLNTATDFATDIAGADGTINVRKTASEVLGADAEINSLILTGGTTISGPQTLKVGSGTILAPSGVTAITATTLDLGGGEANIFVTGGNYASGINLTISSALTNASAVIKSGWGQVILSGNSTFTGPLIQNSGGGGGNNAEGVILRGTLATTDVRVMRDNMVLASGDNRLSPSTILMVNAGAKVFSAKLAGDVNTSINQTIRGLIDGPDGGGILGGTPSGGTAMPLNLTINTAAGDDFTFSGTAPVASLVKAGPGRQVFINNPGAFTLSGGIARTEGGHGFVKFDGGQIEGAHQYDQYWTTTGTNNSEGCSSVNGGGWTARGGMFSVWGLWGSHTWGTVSWYPDGAPMIMQSATSDSILRLAGAQFDLGTSATPIEREIRVNHNSSIPLTQDLVNFQGNGNGVIAGTDPNVALYKSGPGLLLMYNMGNTYVGGTHIGAGVLQVNTDACLGAPNTVAFDTATLQFAGNFTLNGGRTIKLNTGGTGTLDLQGYNISYNGQITGDGALVKAGTGKLTLTNTSNNTGPISIKAGTVEMSTGTAMLGTGNITVASGATLSILAATANTIPDTSTVSLAVNAGVYGIMSLGTGVNETITHLVLDGVIKDAGTYGSATSGATYQLPSWFTGAGMLTVLLSGAIPGDLNGDGLVNAADIDLEFAAVKGGLTDAKYNLNGTGGVDQADVDYLVQTMLHSQYGDANLTKTVDADDYVVWFNNVGNTAAGWANADFNGSTSVDADDYVLWFNNLGFSSASSGAGVPEPMTMSLLALGGLAILRRNRK